MTSIGAQAEPRPPGSFIGRERELSELRASLADVTAGHGHLFLLSGEPGIGKTRLADEFGRFAVVEGVQVAWGRCWEGGGAPAYWPWIQVVRACLADTDAEQRAAILGAEATPQVAQDIAQLLPELRAAHAPIPRPTGAQPTDPDQARFQLFESITTLLKNIARTGPLVIVIDDLHDADHPSLLLLKFIAGHSKDARILLVGTYRDTEVRQSPELSKLIGDLSREGHSDPILGLSEAEVGEFLENTSGRKADKKLVADLCKATDGNPLFVDGLVRLLVAEGKLDRAAASDALRIPDGLQESIRRRLVKLSEETRLLLSVASVIGNQVETQVLAHVSESAAEEIAERMEGALRAGIVIDPPIGGSRYAFAHALVRRTLYEKLSLSRKQSIHLKVAQAIESVHQRNLEPHVAALANHYRMAGAAADAEKTIDYSIRAGSAAFAVFAYEEAEAHWQAALELMDELGGGDPKRRADLLWLLGGSDGLVSSGAKALEYLEEAAPLFEELGDNQAAHEVHLRLAGLRSSDTFGLMDMRRAMAHFKKAEAFLVGQPESHHHAFFYIHMAAAYYSTGRIGDGLAVAKRTMEICERLDPQEPADLRLSTGRSEQSGWRLARLLDPYWSIAAALSSQFLVYSGSVTEGLRFADQARRRADPNSDTAIGSNVAWIGAGNHYFLRNPREAQEWCKSELAKPRTANVVYRRVRENATPRDLTAPIGVHQALVAACALAGELAQARAYLAEADGVNKPAILSFFEGEWELAGKLLTAEFQQSHAAGHRVNELTTGRDLARLLWFAGERVQAVQVLQRVIEISVDCGMILFELAIRSSLATMAADVGDVAQASPHLQRCREIVGAGENWFGRAGDVQRAEAAVAAAKGEFSAAEAHFEKAIATYQCYSLPWEEADTLQYWGRGLLAAGESARAIEKFDAAIKIYRSRGAGTRFIQYVMADKMRAQGSKSTHLVAKSRSHSARAEADIPSGEAVFRNEGEFWTIAYADRRFRLKDMRGLHYIAYVLAHPNERFHVRELSAGVNGDGFSRATSKPGIQADPGDAPPILDSKAKADYRALRSELRADLEEAERMNDTGRVERVRQELELVNDELSTAVGLTGRDRKMSDPSERTRLRIFKAIRSALSEIRDHDPSLAHHLTTCIRTGYYCVYFPDPRQPIWWKF